ncbi:Hypothetical predicted protein, partial [Mytilus galloprovincialis]
MSSEIRRRSMRSKTKASKGEDDEKIQKPVWVKLTGLGGGAWWPAKMESHSAVSFWSDNSRMKVKKKCIKPFELHISSLVKFTRDKLKKAGSDLKEDFELDLSKATAMLQEDKFLQHGSQIPASVDTGMDHVDMEFLEDDDGDNILKSRKKAKK